MNTDFSALPPLELWKRGTYLSRAPFAFAPKELRQDYDEASAVGIMETFSNQAKRSSEVGQYGSAVFQEALLKATEVSARRSEAVAALQNFVTQHLLRGSLVGYGFEPPRRMESQPFEIPRGCWHGRLDWTGSKVRGQGLEFIEVRLIAASAKKRFLESLVSQEVDQPKSVGRPTIGPHIKAVFTAMKDSGEIDIQASAKSHFDAVRRHLRLIYPDQYPSGRKLTYEGIRSHFSPLFNELKKNSKQ